MSHIHESPPSMLIPLFILAAGSLFSGYMFYDLFVGGSTTFWGTAIFVLPQDEVIKAAHHVEGWVEWCPTFAALIGIGIAYIFYTYAEKWPEQLAHYFRKSYNFLYHKWYFDELYNYLFVNPSLKLGKFLWEEGDQEAIDGLGPNGLAAVSLAGGGLLCRLQTGYVYHYAFAMVVGLALMIGWYFWV
jgi:NADH-quinone oxidoreductase subunit L